MSQIPDSYAPPVIDEIDRIEDELARGVDEAVLADLGHGVLRAESFGEAQAELAALEALEAATKPVAAVPDATDALYNKLDGMGRYNAHEIREAVAASH
ncbi:MAG TPA: hypothetical protein VIJ68_01480 [Candidatus Saccharimonadales bacterium]